MNKIERRGIFKDIDKQTIIKESKKVIELYKYLYKKYKNISNPTDEQKRIISSFIKLTIYFDKLDDEKLKFLILSISHFKQYYEVHIFIGDLIHIKNNRDKKETARYLGKIMIELLKKTIPSTFKDNIRSIIEFLYSYSTADNTIKNYANEICNIYADKGIYDEKGSLFLHDLYDRYN